MERNNYKSIQKNNYSLLFFVALVAGIILFSTQKIYSQPPRWEAPTSADTQKNPFQSNMAATAKGKITFEQLCLPCHGAKGKGDGPAGITLNPMPQDLTSAMVQKQTDGAIFWKVTNGRPPMAPYNSILTDEQRWQLVNYLRQLKTGTK